MKTPKLIISSEPSEIAKSLEILSSATRQYRKNFSDNHINAYDIDTTNEIVHRLLAKIASQEMIITSTQNFISKNQS